ncbi:HYC_CC_PP family protein [Subsaximicrobium wynnwilliamsii]|nr:hypothetical protein [Subsaximicrobium wynnwilliamsii]
MVKQHFRRIFSLLMAFFVLLSTVSFTIGKHFCGDELIDVSVFVQADHCGMAMESDKNLVPEKKSCCNDEFEVVKGQDKLKITKYDDLQFDQQFFLSSFAYPYNKLFEGVPLQIIPHKNYSPPNLIADIQVLDQVFLI